MFLVLKKSESIPNAFVYGRAGSARDLFREVRVRDKGRHGSLYAFLMAKAVAGRRETSEDIELRLVRGEIVHWNE